MTGAITKAITALVVVCRELEGDKLADEPRAALTELIAFKACVNTIEHKVDPETDQFHAPSWIIELAYLAQEGVKE